MRKTKIICTLGPASCTYETIKAMALAGMNVARVNMSHGTHEEHMQTIQLVKRVRNELGIALPVMVDTKGPEVRIRTFENGKVTLDEGSEFTFTTDDIVGNEKKVSVSYDNLAADLKAGDRILLNNGLLEFCVKSVRGSNIKTEVITGGVLSDRKSMFFPGVSLGLPFLSDADIADLEFAVAAGADFIAASFVSTAFDLRELRNFLKRKRARRIDIIAKIEGAAGLANLESILPESDGIMVARGDLGVEVAFEKLPAIQKKIIKTSRMMGKRVITATEMLESMIEKPRPTRAEISDVANAVYDGTSCIMLSGETSVGKYPVQVVRAMSNIARSTEKDIAYDKLFKKMDFKLGNVRDAISHATCNTAIDLKAKAIVVFTSGGMTARMVSRFRCSVPIIGVTTNEEVFQKLSMSWGVIPVLSPMFSNTDELMENAHKLVGEHLPQLKKGDVFVITAGLPLGTQANTNFIKVEEVR